MQGCRNRLPTNDISSRSPCRNGAGRKARSLQLSEAVLDMSEERVF